MLVKIFFTKLNEFKHCCHIISILHDYYNSHIQIILINHAIILLQNVTSMNKVMTLAKNNILHYMLFEYSENVVKKIQCYINDISIFKMFVIYLYVIYINIKYLCLLGCMYAYACMQHA